MVNGRGGRKGGGGNGVAAEQLLGAKPLYRQTRDLLVQRIVDGVWAPGEVLPSETQLAAELGVSQGTVRKALDEMTAERLVVRRQGRGTFVASLDDSRILFQFFKLIADDGEPRFPASRVLEVETMRGNPKARRALQLDPAAWVIAITRVRSLAEEPCVFEHITLPAAYFSGIEERPIPNNLYQLYAVDYGVTVGRATERLKAVAAGAPEADALGVAAGTPLLAIDRVATAIDGRICEWRVSLCRTDQVHYLSDLR